MEQSTNHLRMVAPEIRSMIFKHALKIPNAGLPRLTPITPEKPLVPTTRQVPSLLAALRAAPDLYAEALDVFYKVNTFVLDLKTFQCFCGLKLESVNLIRSIVIDLRADVASKESARDFFRIFTYSRSNLAFATRVQKLTIVSCYEEPVVYSLIDNGIKNWTELGQCTLIAEHRHRKANHLETQMLEYFEQCFAMKESTSHWKREQLVLKGGTATGWNARLVKAYKGILRRRNDPKY